MREKLGPWIPAIFCAALAIITVVGNLVLAFVTRLPQSGVDLVFYLNLPMCFYMVAVQLIEIRKNQAAMQLKIDELTEKLTQEMAKSGRAA